MKQTTVAIACLLLYTAASVGEESPLVPRPATMEKATQQAGFRVEIKVVQGKRLLEHSFPRGAMIPGFDGESSGQGSTSDMDETNDSSSAEALANAVKPEVKFDLWNLDKHYPGLTTLAEPALVTVENRPAAFSIRNKKSFHYLVPDGNDRFRVNKTPPHELGISVELTIRMIPAEQDAVELAPLKVSQATLDGREPITGLDLDAGKPIISKRSVETTARCVLDTPRCVPISTVPGRQTVLLVRISRGVESRKRPQLPGQQEAHP